MQNPLKIHSNIPAPALPHTRDWRRIGLWLVAATMAYNVLEGVVAVWAGLEARSIALIGFGLDSFIECAAAAALFWRLGIAARGADPETIERGEGRVYRFVGGTFLALALYVLIQVGWTLWHQEAVSESRIGIILAIASLIVMPLVSWGKLHAANAISSAALRAEAKETLACSYLSFTLLLGLLANAVVGWWWADPIAALLMMPWLVKEGIEGVRGEHCAAGCGEAGQHGFSGTSSPPLS
jgi:divalent metal cation (Fe/Co/Zn/Cd) transporter